MSREIQTLAATLALAFTMSTPITSAAAEAMRVVRDPVTGELRAQNAAEAAAFEKAEAQLRAAKVAKGEARAPAPVEIRHPDGSVEMQLGDDTHMYSIATSGADGSLTLDCVPAKEAQKRLKSSKKASAKTAGKVGHEH